MLHSCKKAHIIFQNKRKQYKSSQRNRTNQLHIINIMTADNLVTRVRTSRAMRLTYFAGNNLGPMWDWQIQSGAIIMQSNISYNTSVIEALHKSEFVLTKNIPYLALKSELWGVYCEEKADSVQKPCIVFLLLLTASHGWSSICKFFHRRYF